MILESPFDPKYLYLGSFIENRVIGYRIKLTPVGSPDRAERDILGVTLGVFGQLVQASFVVGEQFCDILIPC